MATKTLYNSPTVNPFSFLQQEGQGDAAQGGDKRGPAKNDDPNAVLTPAQKAERRAAANAEKVKEAEAAKQKAQADAALAALVGPLDDFVTQKGAKKSEQRAEKKLKREEFEASGAKDNKGHHDDGFKRKNDGEKRQFDGPKKDRAPGEKKQFNNREGGSGHFEKKDRSDNKKQHQGYQPPRRGREFDKHSAGKTSNKGEDKRHGEGAANWGNAITDATTPTEAGWGDEGAEPTQQTEKPGWGTPEEGEEKKEEEAPVKEKREEKPAWDDEGFNKMTYKEFQEKVAAERAVALQKAVGAVQPRERDLKGVDLSKFVEKDNFDEDNKYGKKTEKKDKKKPQPAARAGEKAVDLAEVFSVGKPGGRGGRGGRGGAQGDRQQQNRGGQQGGRGGADGHKVPPKKQFPELSAAVSK